MTATLLASLPTVALFVLLRKRFIERLAAAGLL